MAARFYSVLIISGFLFICFPQCQSENNIHDLFQFEQQTLVQINLMTGERIRSMRNVSMPDCRTECLENEEMCHQAIFSELDYEPMYCHPHNCSRHPARGAEGDCHLMKEKETQKIEFSSEFESREIEGKMWNQIYHYLDCPQTCRGEPEKIANAEIKDVTKDSEREGCYIFLYRCIAGYTYVGGPESRRCCDYVGFEKSGPFRCERTSETNDKNDAE